MRSLLFFLLLVPLFSLAQDAERYQVRQPYHILKFSPLSLLDPQTSLQFALEHQVGEKASLQHEVGYMVNSIYPDENYKNPRGLRIRNELRLYLESDGNQLKGLYAAPEFLFTYVSYERNSVFGKGCNNPTNPWDCNYYQLQDYTVEKQVYGVHQKLGYQEVTSSIVLDIYWGFGFRHVKVKALDRPPNGMDHDGFFGFAKEPGNYNLFSMSLGAKVGVLLFNRQRRLEQEMLKR